MSVVKAAKKVVIVGGGPGGLTLARLLQMQGGADVSVYERDTDRHARITGSALDLHTDSGLAALEAAGLMDAFWANHRPELDRLRLMNNRGELLYDHQRSNVSRPEIERTPLRHLLLDSLKPVTVHWNKKFERASVSEGGDTIRLEFTGGGGGGAETVLADLVIGCDGANSRLRSLVTPELPTYAGVTLVEGVVPQAATAVPEVSAMLGDSAIMALGAEQTLGLARKTDGSILFYAGLKSPDDVAKQALEAASSTEERVGWFHRYFREWSDMWAQLFAHAESFAWRPLYTYPLHHRWTAKANVTLLGDAAHVIPPYAGEGVNMAMMDALVLSRELSRQPDTRAAIAAYQDEMFARMESIGNQTVSNTAMFYAPDASTQVVAMFRRFAQNRADAAAAEVEPISNLSN